MGAAFLVVLGVVIHIVLLIAIFDIYFVSPITQGVSPITNDVPTPCERVVFISIDGLRMDALLEQDENNTGRVSPYLRRKMSEWGAWGVSNCHLPTESRPGHVAMLAGFYEDPSAVTKGWKENPVDFDSLFNRSACCFAWGSPDIVNIFYKGLKHSCAYKWTYDGEQDFAGNTMAYDNWVYENTEIFFETAETRMYSTSKSLFFLHLLGQDTSGHTHKPWTENYWENLRNVDNIIRKVDHLFSKVFPDNKTSYVVSADHGMTDWGSHGAGDPSETLTPIVTWGCGIKKRQPSEEKIEINQADITPLVAVLLGVSIPVNSVGILPSQLLNLSRLEIAEANLLNAKQIAAQYMKKRVTVEAKAFFSLYRKFDALDAELISEMEQSISLDIRQGRPGNANEKSRTLAELSLEGLRYYNNYFQIPLLMATSAVFIGWILSLLLNIKGVELGGKITSSFLLIVAVPGSFISFIIYSQELPHTYHAFFYLPILLWGILLQHHKELCSTMADTFQIRWFTAALLIIVSIQSLVFGFFQRWALSLSIAVIVIWPFFQINLKSRYKLLILWTLSGLSLAVFSLIPVVGKVPNPIFPLLASVLIAAALFAKSWNRNLTNIGKVLAVIRCTLIISAGLNNYIVHSSFITNGHLTSANAIISWFLLAFSLTFFFEPSVGILDKLNNSFSILTVPFLLLSISHEGFFLLALFIHMSCWINLEMINEDVVGNTVFYQQYTRKKLHDGVNLLDFRRAYFFLAYIYIGFFGVGNLASLNSFDPVWVRCFLTTFSPFTMTTLILLKVIIPFFTVSLALRALTIILNIQPYKIFLIVLVYCNLMGLNFLFLIRNEGSWLDIGTSLSHYVIQQVTIVFLLLLNLLSQVVMPIPGTSATAKLHSL